MRDLYRDLVSKQYAASLCMLGLCIDRCPDALWDARVARFPFSQAAFHTLFFTDLYLSKSIEDQRNEPFHIEHAAWFADYEQLEQREPTATYERPDIHRYLQHCRTKAEKVIAAETQESLAAQTTFSWRKVPRAELHIYNIRHIQHHAAQLSLRLRLDAGIDTPWIGTGWREA
jgi:uncharacterized damage-inducible protein DinB